jgi:hypothetical protein
VNRNTRGIIVRPYSHDIRIRVLHAYQHAEQSQRQIARRFNVSLSFVRDLIRRYRETGSIAPRKYPGRPNSKIDKDSLDLILALAADDPYCHFQHCANDWPRSGSFASAARLCGEHYKSIDPTKQCCRLPRTGSHPFSDCSAQQTHHSQRRPKRTLSVRSCGA